MGLDSWRERSRPCPLEAAGPVVWVRQASQAAAQGCQSPPEIQLCISLLATSVTACVSCCTTFHRLMQASFLIAWESNFPAAKWRDSGRDRAGFLNKLQSCGEKRRQGGERGRCLPFIWIFRMTHLVPGKLLFLTDGKLCSQGRAKLSGEPEIKNYHDSFMACERRCEVRCDFNQRWLN